MNCPACKSQKSDLIYWHWSNSPGRSLDRCILCGRVVGRDPTTRKRKQGRVRKDVGAAFLLGGLRGALPLLKGEKAKRVKRKIDGLAP